MSDCKKKVYRRSSCGPIEVGDGRITVKYLGKEVGRFTVDQCSDALIDIAPDGAGDPALWEQFTWCEDCFYWCEPRSRLNCDPCPEEEEEFDEVAPYDDCGDCPDGGWGLDWECAIDKLIEHGLWDKLPWEDWPICDDCFVYCDQSGRQWTTTDFRKALHTFPDQLLLNAAKPEPNPEPVEKKTTVLKFYSVSCGICGKMAKYDYKAVEQLGYEYKTVKRSDTEDWEKYQYVLDQIYGPDDVLGFPTYVMVEGTNDEDMVALGEVKGGRDKGAFKQQLLKVYDARESEEDEDETAPANCGCPRRGSTFPDHESADSNGQWVDVFNAHDCTFKYSRCFANNQYQECKSKWCRGQHFQDQCGSVGQGSESKHLYDLVLCDPPSDPCDGKDCGTVDGQDCGKCPDGKKCENNKCVDDTPVCDKDFTLELTCPGECSSASERGRITANANGVANSNVTFNWYKGAAGSGDLVHSGMGATSYDAPCPPAGTTQKYACQANYKNDDGCDITRTDNCQLSTKADTPSYQCKPNDCGVIQGVDCGGCENGFECKGGQCVEVDTGCDKTLKISHNAPTECKQEGHSQQVTCSTTTAPTNECTWQWVEQGNVVGSGPSISLPWGPGKRTWTVTATYKKDGCDLTDSVQISTTVCGDPCAGKECGDFNGNDCGKCPEGQKCVNNKCEDDVQPPYQCKTGDCGVIQGVNCGGCPEGQECVNNKCQDKPPYQCKTGDCGTIQGVDCGNCPEGQTCQNGRCVDVTNPCDGKDCGTWGGQNCGTCPEGQSCQNGRCVDDPDPVQPCLGRDCGVGTDGVTNCGTCPEGQSCQGGKCVDDPDPVQPCLNIDCGTGTDGTTDCGSCVENHDCVNGKCVEVVNPCADIDCGVGTDGVTDCGTCPDGFECDGGECIPSYQFECPTDCTGWSVNWKCVHDKMAEHGNVLKAGPRITLTPSHGNLWLSDITVSAAGNTGGGVDVIYDPIFIDFEEQDQGDADYWENRAKHFDYFGSRGIQEAASFIPYMVKDVEVSKVFTLTEIPSDANGAFVEINFRGEHSPSPTLAQKHPSYLLDNTVETFLDFKNILFIEGAEFASGQKDSMHNNLGLSLACKLDPVSLATSIQVSSNRQQKLNFMDFTAGATVKVQTKVYVIHYHYTSASMGLGRAKITPVKYTNSRENIKLIQRQLDDFNSQTEYGTEDKYHEKPADVVRMQGADLRQAVDQLNSAIDFKLAIGGGNTAQIQQLRSDLNSQVLQGSGNFEAIRDRLTALKTTAKNLGVIGLTKLESDNGVNWLQPGDTNHPL